MATINEHDQFDQTTQQELKNDTLLEKCATELQEVKNSYVHLVADFENYKRRQEKERLQWSRSAQIDIIAPLLNILDDFERALEQKTDSENVQNWVAGFQLIHKEFIKYLDKIGIKNIEVKPQDQFNPEIHESIMTENVDQPAGTIVTVLQKGFTFKDFVIRPAKVSIASGS